MRKSGFLLTLVAIALAACGGGEDGNKAFQPPLTGGGDGGAAQSVAALTLVTSSPMILSDNSGPAEITAYVRDARNQFMENVPVTFSADDAGLLVTQGNTDENGIARATLSTAGNPAVRSIVVTATAGMVTQTVTVNVAGTGLALQGQSGLALNQTGTYTVSLRDAGGHGIAGRDVAITSQRNNVLNPGSVTTDAGGFATFTMQAVNSGNDTLTVSALGVTASKAVTVNSDAFVFLDPDPATVPEVALGASQPITVELRSGGAVVAGATVNFSTTRGTLTVGSAVTNASGIASTSISAANAGPAIVSATSGGNSAQQELEFVATTPDVIDVQPSVFTLGTGQTSTVTAVVRDSAGNLVKNQVVVFQLDDVTGGTLSVGSATTDSQGRAETVYAASSTTSANEGVKITASVQGTAIQRTVSLTVARREAFLSLGTGNEVEEPNQAQYRLQYAVQVTDSNGNGVGNVPVSLRILSLAYHKGVRTLAVSPATGWSTTYATPFPAGCVDEDVNRNGILDAGEDINNNGRIEAGNIATVSPANAVTDGDGMVLVYVTYPQEHAYYVDVELSASANVEGSEYVRSARFMLPGSAPDFSDPQVAPPGQTSPFGVGNSCANTD